MQAYHGKKELKETVLKELRYHYEADNIVKGQYWEDGKGCAVGCLLKSGNHIEYEEKFGIPVAFARLEDTIFEGLPNDLSKKWPIDFMSSFEVGKDYSNVIWDFLKWLLLDHLLPQIKEEGKMYDDVRNCIKQSAACLGNNSSDAAYAARAAYARAAYADADAAAAAARAARAAYAAYAAYADADAAAAAARAAARAARYAADAADADAARDDAYIKFSQKLIKLIKEVK